ncbi:MAG: DUF4190 domain-containing protein [Pyrinomonadaceae bacterium]
MKKCPNCQKTFDDAMKFCQTDGTPLVVVAEEPDDPYKTMVAGGFKLPEEQPETPAPASEPVLEAAPEPVIEDSADVLEIPDEGSSDPMKTVVVSGSATSDNIKIPDLPPAEAADPEAPVVEDTPAASHSDVAPEIPKFSEPQIEMPDLSAPVEEAPVANATEEKPWTPPAPDKSAPIPSPFESSMPPGVTPPDIPLFDPEPEPVAEMTPPPPAMDAPPSPFSEPDAAPASPFSESNQAPASPFAEPEAPASPAASDWSSAPMSPAAPASPSPFGSNEIVGQSPNSPALSTAAQNNTLPIVSLCLGIGSLVCCVLGIFLGPAALVTGYMAKGNISREPENYGGGGMATAGMITGGVGLLLFVVWLALQIFGVVLQGF